jgi:predicted SprT family Zn-dependent metalloprotease
VAVDVFDLFSFYNSYFFHGRLDKCVVKWSKRMTLCAGTCKYEGMQSSTITLSEALLQYRSSDEVKETLLHEMIHAYLFIMDPDSCKVDGGHGPPFQKMMREINAATGLKVTIYHSFHDEV